MLSIVFRDPTGDRLAAAASHRTLGITKHFDQFEKAKEEMERIGHAVGYLFVCL